MSMKYGQVPGVEKPISRIVQGVIQINKDNEAAGFAQLDAAFEAGINCVDTAHLYGNSDEFLGKWIRSRDLREKVVVLAKGNHHNGHRRRVTPYDIGHDLHDTLARMKTDYVDMYVMHRDDENYPVEPIIDALNQFSKEGKIKAFGGSNWTIERIQAANDYAKASGQIPLAVSSPNFSLADQIEEPWDNCVTISGPKNEAVREWYHNNNMPIFAWSSMAGGFWSGRFTRDNINNETGEYFSGLVQKCYNSEDNFVRLDRAKELGDAKGASIPQIALAYVLNYPANIFALVGSANKSELDANVAAVSITLTPQELAYLDLKADKGD